MNYVFIINSFSLKKETNKIKSKLINVCEKLNLNYEIEINSNSNPTEKIVKKYHDSHSIIVCLGGDGTINRTLNSIIGTNNVLGYVPLGTGNDFYKTNRETLKNGNHEKDKYVTKIRTTEVRIESLNETECLIDGEVLKNKKFNVKVIPKGIKIFYDENLIGELLK